MCRVGTLLAAEPVASRRRGAGFGRALGLGLGCTRQAQCGAGLSSLSQLVCHGFPPNACFLAHGHVGPKPPNKHPVLALEALAALQVWAAASHGSQRPPNAWAALDQAHHARRAGRRANQLTACRCRQRTGSAAPRWAPNRACTSIAAALCAMIRSGLARRVLLHCMLGICQGFGAGAGAVRAGAGVLLRCAVGIVVVSGFACCCAAHWALFRAEVWVLGWLPGTDVRGAARAEPHACPTGPGVSGSPITALLGPGYCVMCPSVAGRAGRDFGMGHACA